MAGQMRIPFRFSCSPPLTLLVVTTGDPEDVSLPLVSDGVGGNLLGHPLFDEDSAVFPL